MIDNVVAIVSTAHWQGDPRLNRHVSYLQAAGYQVTLSTHSDKPRGAALLGALSGIWRGDGRRVILPDPDLFVLGSLVARLRRKLPILDIHEDYAKAAMARPWIPDYLRPIVRALASLNTVIARAVAWRTMTAAPELSTEGDFLVLNLPDPASVDPSPYEGDRRLLYIGDLTLARGAVEMIEVLSHLDETFELVLVGPTDVEVGKTISEIAAKLGVSGRVITTGRLSHREAWTTASGSLVGLSLLTDVPAYREAVATKLWEYMAHGIPPVVSDLPGQRRLIAQLDESLICRSTAEVAAAIQDLVGDVAKRIQLGRSARSLIEKAWADNRPDLAVQSVVAP